MVSLWSSFFALYRAGPATAVALLAEGVDRNHNPSAAFPAIMESPSSRRAQVEIDTKIW